MDKKIESLQKELTANAKEMIRLQRIMEDETRELMEVQAEREQILAALGDKKPVPDPTCVEETGCAGCPNTEFDIKKCEECSPPQAPVAAKLKKKFNPLEQKVKKKTGPKPGTGKGNPYGIPSALFSENRQLYQRLWSRCKKKGIKYEEALIGLYQGTIFTVKGYRCPACGHVVGRNRRKNANRSHIPFNWKRIDMPNKGRFEGRGDIL